VNDPHAAQPATQDAAAADAVLMAQLLHLPTTNNAAASAGAADPTPGPDAGSFDSAGGADFSGGDGGASGSW
jgi:hypothetical protein